VKGVRERTYTGSGAASQDEQKTARPVGPSQNTAAEQAERSRKNGDQIDAHGEAEDVPLVVEFGSVRASSGC
jgi:hypothetical protein